MGLCFQIFLTRFNPTKLGRTLCRFVWISWQTESFSVWRRHMPRVWLHVPCVRLQVRRCPSSILQQVIECTCYHLLIGGREYKGCGESPGTVREPFGSTCALLTPVGGLLYIYLVNYLLLPSSFPRGWVITQHYAFGLLTKSVHFLLLLICAFTSFSSESSI